MNLAFLTNIDHSCCFRSCSTEEHRDRDGSRSVVRRVQSGYSTEGSSERPWNPVYIGLHEEGN